MTPVSNERVLDIISNSAGQTQRLGARLGELARPGDIYCLEGELGSGKTCFVQGLGKGLGIPAFIHSPTFILANEHRGGRLPLYHIDVYRVRGADEAIGFGLEDYMTEDGVCVIEWAEKIREALPDEHLWITFRHLGEAKRSLVIEAQGSRYESLLEEFRNSAYGNANAPRH